MEALEGKVIELAYALDTFYFLVMGAFVMWMAAGFTMLESGLVRAKNTAEILTKNISLYSIAVIMYMIVGYNLMYPGGGTGVIPELAFFLGEDNTAEASAVLSSPKKNASSGMTPVPPPGYIKLYPTIIYIMTAIEYKDIFFVRISAVFFALTSPDSSIVNPAAIHMTKAPMTKK